MAINKAMPAASGMQAVPRQSMVCYAGRNQKVMKGNEGQTRREAYLLALWALESEHCSDPVQQAASVQ